MNTPEPKPVAPRRSLWPYMIIGYFVIFISAMAVWIVFALRQDMDLVRKDYYEEEIRFQKHLDSAVRTQSVRSEVRADYDQAKQSILITLPVGHLAQQPRGSIQLYRPSDAKLDRQFELALDSQGRQLLDVRAIRSGLWKIRVNWNVNGQDFFFDQSLVVNGG